MFKKKCRIHKDPCKGIKLMKKNYEMFKRRRRVKVSPFPISYLMILTFKLALLRSKESESKGLSIYYVIQDGGGRGSSRFITILHRGLRQNLLQYYSFERKMEGYNPFLTLNKLKGFHFILFNADLCLRILSQIRKNVANTRF